MKKILIEVCCGSAEDAVTAVRCGADRIELNSALVLGGLTPSVGALEAVRTHSTIPVMAMVRPRGGGFCYSEADFAAMLYDAHILTDRGADGVVFGVLRPDGTVDEERVKRLLDAAGPAQTVFSRAMDVVPDWKRAMDTLITLGVTRVLTSGCAPTAVLGADTIREMIAFTQGAIEILPGAGLRPENARAFAEHTGAAQLHLSCSGVGADASAENDRGVCLTGTLPRDERTYRTTDAEALQLFRRKLTM